MGNCSTCGHCQFGWSDDWVDNDYHDYVCNIGGVEGFILDSHDYETEEEVQKALRERGLDCKNWIPKYSGVRK